MFHLTSTGCALVLQKDLEYWGIDELMMEPCCALKYYPEIETCVNEKQVKANFFQHTFFKKKSIWTVLPTSLIYSKNIFVEKDQKKHTKFLTHPLSEIAQ